MWAKLSKGIERDLFTNPQLSRWGRPMKVHKCCIMNLNDWAERASAATQADFLKIIKPKGLINY